MAKKYYDGDITLKTDWGGDSTTDNLPVVGSKVQAVIKDGINSKVGYVGRVDKTGQGFYVLSRDEETFNAYLETITDTNPFGDLQMEGIEGRRFDAPFNYKMSITLQNPENGYKSTLLGSTGNVIRFTAQTLDANDTPQGESLTITFKVITEGGVETSYTAIYDGEKASKGIEYNLDGKLGAGQNTVVITAVGMNTGISAMRRITYRLIDMSFADKFDITKRYQFANDGSLNINVGYALKGVGKTQVVWYFDGNLYTTDTMANTNPNLQNANRAFYFNKSADQWLTPGIHNLQVSMVCVDTDSGEEFQTPIYYREFIIEETPTVLETPYIVRKASFDASKGFLSNGEVPTIYNAKQFENTAIEYAAYYNGKSECNVVTTVVYSGLEPIPVSNEKLPMVSEGFSEIKKQSISLEREGYAEIVLTAKYGTDGEFTTKFKVEVGASDMNITTVTDSVALSLSAFNHSNDSENRDSWTYTNEKGDVIETTFSKNEYVIISTENEFGEVIAPSDATEENTLEVSELPSKEIEDIKYLKLDGKFYIWTREFDWSNTSGWHDNKLKLANGNAITINYMPFSSDKLTNLNERGGTYEFEFETTNVYNDDAVICRICGTKNFAPGISIYASGAELVVSREVDEPVYDEDGELININAGYIKAVSTKYKAEESNRISFVITPDGDKNSDGSDYRDRILKIYVNGELCGAYPYDKGANFLNDSKITFRGSEDACVNISSVQIYQRALSSNEVLSNYIYFRNDAAEKAEIYKRNNVMLDNNDETFDSDKLKSQLPVMMFYQIDPNQSLDDIHQEKKNKKLTRFFDVVYVDIQNPHKNFLVKNAYITPQGTSSMNYPVKNLRLYTGKKDDAGNYYSRLFVGSNIFIDGSPSNLDWKNINLDTEVSGKRLYSFRDEDVNGGQKAAAPVNCWCLKADFAESSSSHNTGTARFWNNVLKTAGFTTKAQVKAAKYSDLYPYDVRTCIDGFPIAVFYQSLGDSAPRFEGKYNFNNDKSTESVFGFTGGEKVKDQEVKYFYIGKNRPIIQSETDMETGKVEYACSWSENGYTETPDSDSPLYTSDSEGNWYMLRGKELLDNPKMECWELLNSVNEIALFKTMKGFGVGDGDEKVGIVNGDDFDEAFESRYPDCGDYYHYNSLKRFGEWLVSCRYLDIDSKTGESVPFEQLPLENYHRNNDGKLSICSLSKQKGEIEFDFPGVNFYKEVDYETIKSNIKNEGYQAIEIKDNDILATLEYREVEKIPTVKDEEYEYLKCNGIYYTWLPSNVLESEAIPEVHELAYDYVLVDGKYYAWNNMYKLEDYHETQWVDDTTYNRALKFAIEKYDHIDMEKMAAYYIYLMRFGGVDQTVKNSMLTTEGPATDDPSSTLPSLWYFINYDNDTILGVKNDGRLVFDPYITRQTKDGTGYVYAGRESTLWNNLEEDIQFMEKVTEVDNKLAKGEGNSLYALSYDNAIREYDINQSDKWCERIYNKDAERKYIQTYVEGWTQKVAASGTTNHVYEDYLYDVHGSRSAHRKWWLGRRFNVFDSRFCNTNFMNSLIKFRSTNLPAGAKIKIKSGEPIFYAWGHDNTVTEMTPMAVQPGDSYTFTTKSAFNIGSYLELMGAANIATLDLRDCVGALTEIDVTGCYSYSVGTKMKEIFVGDHTREDLVNISNTSMKFSGLDKATKLEYLDVTNIKNIMALDGLNTLLNIREVYAKGTSVANFTFADGAMIETLELPSTIETLSLTRSSLISYDNIKFEGDKYDTLTNLTINDCAQLMNNPDFVINWIGSKTPAQRANLNLNLQGIDWTFDGNTLNNLFFFEEVGTSPLSQRNIRGHIKLNTRINSEIAVRLKSIFGDECFKEGSIVYIEAMPDLYLNMPDVVWEGENDIRCDIITVGTTLGGDVSVVSQVREIINGENVDKLIENTGGNIVMDASTLSKDYVTYSIKESAQEYSLLYTNATYTDVNGVKYPASFVSRVKKRLYPSSVEILTVADSFRNDEANKMWLNFTESEINDPALEGRGFFSVHWEIVTGTTNYENQLVILDSDKETAYIRAPYGWDGSAEIKVVITRNYDNEIVASSKKTLYFHNPNTIISKDINEPIYDVLVSAGIIEENEGEYGVLTKDMANKITMADLVDSNGRSIFADNTKITGFTEFQWFTSQLMGQMPQEGKDYVLTPDGMFSGCTNLVEIAFPYNFKYTAKNMFEGCKNLKHVYGNSNSRDDMGNPIYLELGFEYIGEHFAYQCAKLETCKLSLTTKFIGKEAFFGCTNLTEMYIAASDAMQIEYTNDTNPFAGCKNITFSGVEYGGVSAARYQIKNGACYEVKKDGTLALVHMGKDTLISDIPTNKQVYACSYAMEYRTEPDIVMPNNVIFNGDHMFNKSTGNSITLTNVLGETNCPYLFYETNYNGNYHFANGETVIPAHCFENVRYTFTNFVVPEGVTVIKSNAFDNCRELQEITFPSTLVGISGTAFWLTDGLKTIRMHSATPPVLSSEDFFNVRLENVYVRPEHYNEYKANIMHLLAPIVKPEFLFEETRVRVIKDGALVLPDASNVITVGGLTGVVEDDYILVTPTEPVYNTDIVLNGEVIGKVTDPITTVYAGDNSSLMVGNGYDFTGGVYDPELLAAMSSNGWFYDQYYKGLRSSTGVTSRNSSTEMSFNIPYYAGKSMPITCGVYMYEDKHGDGDVVEFKSNNGNVLAKIENNNGFDKSLNVTTSDGIVTVKVTQKSAINQGIDGIVINRLGNARMSDPELPAVAMAMTDETPTVSMITVNLSAEQMLPTNKVIVTVTDNKAHTYHKVWNGEPLMFVVPVGKNYTVSADNFISDNGKLFIANHVENVQNGEVSIEYATLEGMEIKGDVLCYYTNYNDYFVYLKKQEGVWSNKKNSVVKASDIDLSDTDGLLNTELILAVEPDNAIFKTASEYTGFGVGVRGYIPSYIELAMFENHINLVNDFLRANNREPLDFTNCWVSESYDKANAWTADGQYQPKSNNNNFYIFGRRVSL